MTDTFDHAGLKALAKKLGRPSCSRWRSPSVTLSLPDGRRGRRRPNGSPNCGLGSISSPALTCGVFIIGWCRSNRASC